MPLAGSQIILCDVPVRFDNYRDCSHACEYCFANRKYDISKITAGESKVSLKAFIEGFRTTDTNWCDWDIPIHWGGMSDPFQPVEKQRKSSLEILKLLAETQYPFIVSTKNKLIAEGEYLELIKQCNCVVQFSAVSPKFDRIEKGASTFAERLEAARAITPYKRVNLRCQPYMIQLKDDVLSQMDMYRDYGIHGVIFEGMKAFTKTEGMVQMGADQCYPSKILKEHFSLFKQALHERGMKFYSGENRLRSMGDELCCCGVEGMGWRVNTANLNHYLYDRENFKFTETMQKKGTSTSFRTLSQSPIFTKYGEGSSYKDCMELQTTCINSVNILLPDEMQVAKKKK